MLNQEAIKNLYTTDESTRKVLEHFTTRQRDRSVLSVTQLHSLTGASYEEIIHTFKSLEELKIGKFIAGKNARFVWDESMLLVASVIKPIVVSKGVEHPADEPRQAARPTNKQPQFHHEIEHVYYLRREDPVRFRLPADITPQEARRLADFVLTLPLEH